MLTRPLQTKRFSEFWKYLLAIGTCFLLSLPFVFYALYPLWLMKWYCSYKIKSFLHQIIQFGFKTRSSKDECSTESNNHLRSKDHRSLSSIDQKILMTSPPRNSPSPCFDLSRSFGVVWMSSEYYSSSFVLLSFCPLFFCLSVTISKSP